MPPDWLTRVSVRVSSHGRLIIPPLHYWKGESIRDLHQCYRINTHDEFCCSGFELDGAKVLNKFVATESIQNEIDVKNEQFMSSMPESQCERKRNGQHWSLPERSVKNVLKERQSENKVMNVHFKTRFDRQEFEAVPPKKKVKTAETMLDTRSVENKCLRNDSYEKTSNKDHTITRSIHRNFKSERHSCIKNCNFYLDKNMQYCAVCSDKRNLGKRTSGRNHCDVIKKDKFLKMYPNLLDLRVKLVDLRHWQCGKLLSLGRFPEHPSQGIGERVRGGVNSCGYWLRQVKFTIPPALIPARRLLQQQREKISSPGSFVSQQIAAANPDSGARKAACMRKTASENSCSEDLLRLRIRDSRVILSPLSSKDLKLLQRGELQPRTVKDSRLNKMGTKMVYNGHKLKRRSARSPSPTTKRISKQKEKVSSPANCSKMARKSKLVQGIITPTKKQPLSAYSLSQRKKNGCARKKNQRRGKCRGGSSDLFEDPLYACLLSSSESEYSINLDNGQICYSEKQSTPLSKYLDVRDESTDRVSVNSTPSRFHSKAELKQHVSKVRRRRAEKLKVNHHKTRKEPEKCFSSVDKVESVEELSAFEQLKRALGLMDKVQKKICEDGYLEEERYFGDSDD
ncbi:uncharacterized protein LOC134530762 isoform X2 [Bacillus rossius redtenbacheri]|uniref:uncharacterized protein LOC134530762 isoform X2 n=1 Tax=Bacillus rossius redtenbacheri TaxID=93214 RepID=UPI002FDDC7C7